ncbi:MAG: hypothetical protein GBAus27B_000046 [Mycoplasmataceae bacterium]|nr:MAG: hypothetical protein GBAus27B_000046 [Mycoplasmataceae bacterium]
MKTQTITVSLTLKPWKVDLLNSLEANSGRDKSYFLQQILTKKNTWTDLIDINDALLVEKNPNRKFYSGQSAKDYLKSLYH